MHCLPEDQLMTFGRIVLLGFALLAWIAVTLSALNNKEWPWFILLMVTGAAIFWSLNSLSRPEE